MERFRTLKADEIEVKVSRVVQYGDAPPKGVTYLLYKTARTDMDLLDEGVGPENWTDDYKEIKGNLYCGIGIWSDARGEFIWKWDCGIESRQDGDGNEKKGEASDAFKRAGFRWGIGRELYTAPEIFVPAEKLKMKQNQKTRKWATYDKLYVEKIKYDDQRRICALAIKNASNGKRGFVWQEENNEAAGN